MRQESSANASAKQRPEVQKDIWKQYEEFKTLDKVFPDPMRTVGCYVQTSEQAFGTIKAVTPSACPSSLAVKLEIDPLAAKKGVITKTASEVKYLARAYLCDLSEICISKMPSSLVSALDIQPERIANSQDCIATDKPSKVVLVQTISTKAKEDPLPTEPTTGSMLEGGNSAHRLHVMLASKEDAFELVPVVFNTRERTSHGKRKSITSTRV